MTSVINKKLTEGEATLRKSVSSIELAKRFPVRGGIIKPPEASWFEAIKPACKDEAKTKQTG